MLSAKCQLVTVILKGLVMVLVHTAEEGERKAWACFGNFHNFLDINCPQDHQVELISMMNGAKPTNQNCPPVTTDDDNFREDCCSFAEGDCVIQTHPNNFPVECSGRPFCRPQSRLADTGPTCNSKDFPKFTHYTEIIYRCSVPQKTKTTSTPKSTTSPKSTSSTSPDDKKTTNASVIRAIGDVTDVNTAHPLAKKDTLEKRDDVTPAMVGGMIAGIVGLILTILIFMFYWGRKRQIRISGKNQNNVWDFLLSNTMSVRAFRGYDNFSSTNVYSSSVGPDGLGGGAGGGAGGGSPSSSPQGVVRRKAMWLPNISVDSGQGHSNVTSDDNCSVVTVERHPGDGVLGENRCRRLGDRGGDRDDVSAGGSDSASAWADPVVGVGGGVTASRMAEDGGDAGLGGDLAVVGGDGGANGGSGGGGGGVFTVENVRSSPDPETGVEASNLGINNL